jgi:hypothetical protein
MAVKSLEILAGSYAIHRLRTDQETPAISEGFLSITRTGEEISVVCRDGIEIPSEKRSPGWRCLKLEGPLQLDQVGILHDLTAPLKKAGISVFAVSTYDTDYLLAPGKSFRKAIRALSGSYRIKSRGALD